jgi:hypothetical protein
MRRLLAGAEDGQPSTRQSDAHRNPARGESRAAKAVLIRPVPPLMVKTAATPAGCPRACPTASRRRLPRFYRDLAGRPVLGLQPPRLEAVSGIYQAILRRGRQCGIDVSRHRFRHHFGHAWLDHGGAEGDLMELNGWASPQTLRRHGASARSARARRSRDRAMEDTP